MHLYCTTAKCGIRCENSVFFCLSVSDCVENILSSGVLMLTFKAVDCQVINFYRAMHYVKRSLAIACRPSVCPSVCNIGDL